MKVTPVSEFPRGQAQSCRALLKNSKPPEHTEGPLKVPQQNSSSEAHSQQRPDTIHTNSVHLEKKKHYFSPDWILSACMVSVVSWRNSIKPCQWSSTIVSLLFVKLLLLLWPTELALCSDLLATASSFPIISMSVSGSVCVT